MTFSCVMHLTCLQNNATQMKKWLENQLKISNPLEAHVKLSTLLYNPHSIKVAAIINLIKRICELKIAQIDTFAENLF